LRLIRFVFAGIAPFHSRLSGSSVARRGGLGGRGGGERLSACQRLPARAAALAESVNRSLNGCPDERFT
jgi:hypothetical protein